MSRSVRFAGFLFLPAFALALFLPTPALAAESIQQSFSVEPGGLLMVRAERGSIEVANGEGSEVEIEIIPRDFDDFQDTFNVSFDQSGNTVSVGVKSKSRISGWFDWGRKGFVLKAWVPHRFNADLKTSGGSISVTDLQGEVKSSTSGGGLSFGQIEGSVFGRTSGGSIQLEECIGDADLETSGGGITLSDVEGSVAAVTSGGSIRAARAMGQVVARTSGGGISLENMTGPLEAKTSGGSIEASITSQPTGDSILETSGGGVTVRISEGVGFQIDAATSGGNVSTDLPLTVQGKIEKTSLKGSLNGGGPGLRLRTSGGSIRIKRL